MLTTVLVMVRISQPDGHGQPINNRSSCANNVWLKLLLLPRAARSGRRRFVLGVFVVVDRYPFCYAVRARCWR